jgi:hypothetical protein
MEIVQRQGPLSRSRERVGVCLMKANEVAVANEIHTKSLA